MSPQPHQEPTTGVTPADQPKGADPVERLPEKVERFAAMPYWNEYESTYVKDTLLREVNHALLIALRDLEAAQQERDFYIRQKGVGERTDANRIRDLEQELERLRRELEKIARSETNPDVKAYHLHGIARRALEGGELERHAKGLAYALDRERSLRRALEAFCEYQEAARHPWPALDQLVKQGREALASGSAEGETEEVERLRREVRSALRALGQALASGSEKCDYCGHLGWTVALYGRVTHKESCPHRTDPWSQTNPAAQAQEVDDGERT